MPTQRERATQLLDENRLAIQAVGRPAVEGEELLQQVSVRIFERLEKLQLDDVRRGRKLVLKIARNEVASILRKHQRHRRALDEIASSVPREMPEPSSILASTEDIRQSEMRTAAALLKVHALPAPDREIVIRHYLAGEPVPQIAAALRMNANTVHSRMQRALKRL